MFKNNFFILLKLVLFCGISFFRKVHPFDEFGREEVVNFPEDYYRKQGFRNWETNDISYSGIEPCRDKGECFSGAWFGRTEHITFSPDLDQFNVSFNKNSLKWFKRARCEDASHWFVHGMYRHGSPNYKWGNIPGQTVDVLDFSGCAIIVSRK